MSRSARGRPEGVVRRRRAARPLPEGPFAVPLSTIDWLVSRESPAARYVALRDLLGRPPKDPDLKRAKQGFSREPFVREALALLATRLAPGAGATALERRYDGGVWLALFLTEVGADGALLHLHHAGDVLLARWEKTLVEDRAARGRRPRRRAVSRGPPGPLADRMGTRCARPRGRRRARGARSRGTRPDGKGPSALRVAARKREKRARPRGHLLPLGPAPRGRAAGGARPRRAGGAPHARLPVRRRDRSRRDALRARLGAAAPSHGANRCSPAPSRSSPRAPTIARAGRSSGRGPSGFRSPSSARASSRGGSRSARWPILQHFHGLEVPGAPPPRRRP